MNSQRIKLVFLALLLTVAVLDSASFSTQSSRKRKAALTDTYKGLKISVTSNLETYSLSDIVSLEIRLRNVGNEPITIYRRFGWGWSSSFFLAVNDSTDKTIQPSFLEDHLPYPNFPKEDFTILQSEEFTKIERGIDLKGYGVKKPGVYFVTVWYRSPVPIGFAPDGLKIWPMEYGRLEAKRVRFRVMK